MKRMAVVLSLAILMMAGGWAIAQENVTVDGKIASVNAEAKTFVVKNDKSGEEWTVATQEKSFYHCYRPGKMEDLQDGVNAKVYGKVAEDFSSIAEVHSICVMPRPSSYTDKKARVDGILKVADGKYSLEYKGAVMPVELKEKVAVSMVTEETFEALQPGVKVRFSMKKKDDALLPASEIRLYGPALQK